MAGFVAREIETEIRKYLHDISNAVTVLVGRVELLSRSKELSSKDKSDIEHIVRQGSECIKILERAKNALKEKT